MNEKKRITSAQAILQKVSASDRVYETWEMGFIALGLSYSDMDAAEAMFKSIFKGQWSNGMLPHFVFDTNNTASANAAQVWQDQPSTHAPKNVKTSSISTLPVHGILLKRIYDLAEDKPRAKAFAQEMFPKVLATHRFFYTNRDAKGNGLIHIEHVEESGMATSPTWDNIPRNKPFKVVDPLLNALICWSNESLLTLGDMIDIQSEELVGWHELTRFSVENELWNDEYCCFNAYDLTADTIIPCCTVSAILPLMSNAMGDTDAQKMLAHLKAPTFGGTDAESMWLCNSYDMEAEDFAPSEQWRGAIAMSLNWMLYHGLKRYDVDALDNFGPRNMGFKRLAERVKVDSLALVERFGWYTYFDARKSLEENGLGEDDNAVTAALFIDFLKGHTDSNDPK